MIFPTYDEGQVFATSDGFLTDGTAVVRREYFSNPHTYPPVDMSIAALFAQLDFKRLREISCWVWYTEHVNDHRSIYERIQDVAGPDRICGFHDGDETSPLVIARNRKTPPGTLDEIEAMFNVAKVMYLR